MDQNRREAERWLVQAERDFVAGRNSASTGSYEWACFQAQQCSEKALKAVLIAQGRRRVLIHSIFELVLEAGKFAPSLLEVRKGTKKLDGAYFASRYPDSIAGELTPGEYYEEEDAEECLKIAESILVRTKAAIRG
ncbi:MAG: HEPN domain-containing protein [Methanomicrobiales archaeon]|nr:HEPN domain-containing protein [Methanomicrobiales archaeon]